MDTFLKEQTVTPEEFKGSKPIINEIPTPKMRPEQKEEDRSDDGGGFIDYLKRLF